MQKNRTHLFCVSLMQHSSMLFFSTPLPGNMRRCHTPGSPCSSSGRCSELLRNPQLLPKELGCFHEMTYSPGKSMLFNLLNIKTVSEIARTDVCMQLSPL